MEQYIDGWDIAAQVRMERQNHKGSFFLLEGSNDSETLGKFIDESACSVVICYGKGNAIEALKFLEGDAFPGVLALVDLDYDSVDGVSHDCDSLIHTDHHDLDMTMFMSRAFVKVLESKGDPARYSESFGEPNRIRDLVLENCLPIATLRWLSGRNGWALKFVDLDFEFISVKDFKCNDGLLIEAVLRNSSPKARAASEAFLRSSFRPTRDHLLSVFCNGHDAIQILGIGLLHCFGKLKEHQVWRSKIELEFRAIFGIEEFVSTGIYDSIRDWESENVPYQVLRAH
ncbi:MAG: DUF4435 domain-containing protein [Dongiaceae bacterium]